MYDSGKIIPGLLIFVLLITFPIWYNNLSNAKPVESPAPPDKAMLTGFTFANGKEHPSAAEMRAKHMEVLQSFHAAADPAKMAAAQKGEKMQTMSCVMCHGSKEQFCDSCHANISEKKVPDCWNCHNK
jgi:cytochrome c1